MRYPRSQWTLFVAQLVDAAAVALACLVIGAAVFALSGGNAP